MTLRERIIRQLALFSLLISVVLTALVFNQRDSSEEESDETAV